MTLCISVVVYRPNLTVLEKTLMHLAAAVACARKKHLLGKTHLIIVDNSPDIAGHQKIQAHAISLFAEAEIAVTFHHFPLNPGYGRAHNQAIFTYDACFHLILNPDVFMEENALSHALEFMQKNRRIGLLVPRCFHGNGSLQFLVKAYPSLLTLLVRGLCPFLPNNRQFQKLFQSRLDDYCRCNENWSTTKILQDEMVSGCFMFFRQHHLKQIKGFSPDYFLYFEDFDISLRMHAVSGIAYHPLVEITHLGGNTSRKGMGHIRCFIRSGFHFFSTHGWRFIS